MKQALQLAGQLCILTTADVKEKFWEPVHSDSTAIINFILEFSTGTKAISSDCNVKGHVPHTIY